jgi:hypothetical protein
VSNITYAETQPEQTNYDKVESFSPSNVVVFSPSSPSGQIYSQKIAISFGELFLFRAFNIPEDRAIYFNGVSVSTSMPTSGGACCPPVGFLSGPDLYIQRMTVGGPDKWVLTDLLPQVLVNLPGQYRLELSNEDMVGTDLYVEYIKLYWTTDRFLGAFK